MLRTGRLGRFESGGPAGVAFTGGDSRRSQDFRSKIILVVVGGRLMSVCLRVRLYSEHWWAHPVRVFANWKA